MIGFTSGCLLAILVAVLGSPQQQPHSEQTLPYLYFGNSNELQSIPTSKRMERSPGDLGAFPIVETTMRSVRQDLGPSTAFINPDLEIVPEELGSHLGNLTNFKTKRGMNRVRANLPILHGWTPYRATTPTTTTTHHPLPALPPIDIVVDFPNDTSARMRWKPTSGTFGPHRYLVWVYTFLKELPVYSGDIAETEVTIHITDPDALHWIELSRYPAGRPDLRSEIVEETFITPPTHGRKLQIWKYDETSWTYRWVPLPEDMGMDPRYQLRIICSPSFGQKKHCKDPNVKCVPVTGTAHKCSKRNLKPDTVYQVRLEAKSGPAHGSKPLGYPDVEDFSIERNGPDPTKYPETDPEIEMAPSKSAPFAVTQYTDDARRATPADEEADQTTDPTTTHGQHLTSSASREKPFWTLPKFAAPSKPQPIPKMTAPRVQNHPTPVNHQAALSNSKAAPTRNEIKSTVSAATTTKAPIRETTTTHKVVLTSPPKVQSAESPVTSPKTGKPTSRPLAGSTSWSTSTQSGRYGNIPTPRATNSTATTGNTPKAHDSTTVTPVTQGITTGYTTAADSVTTSSSAETKETLIPGPVFGPVLGPALPPLPPLPPFPPWSFPGPGFPSGPSGASGSKKSGEETIGSSTKKVQLTTQPSGRTSTIASTTAITSARSTTSATIPKATTTTRSATSHPSTSSTSTGSTTRHTSTTRKHRTPTSTSTTTVQSTTTGNATSSSTKASSTSAATAVSSNSTVSSRTTVNTTQRANTTATASTLYHTTVPVNGTTVTSTTTHRNASSTTLGSFTSESWHTTIGSASTVPPFGSGSTTMAALKNRTTSAPLRSAGTTRSNSSHLSDPTTGLLVTSTYAQTTAARTHQTTDPSKYATTTPASKDFSSSKATQKKTTSTATTAFASTNTPASTTTGLPTTSTSTYTSPAVTNSSPSKSPLNATMTITSTSLSITTEIYTGTRGTLEASTDDSTTTKTSLARISAQTSTRQGATSSSDPMSSTAVSTPTTSETTKKKTTSTSTTTAGSTGGSTSPTSNSTTHSTTACTTPTATSASSSKPSYSRTPAFSSSSSITFQSSDASTYTPTAAEVTSTKTSSHASTKTAVTSGSSGESSTPTSTAISTSKASKSTRNKSTFAGTTAESTNGSMFSASSSATTSTDLSTADTVTNNDSFQPSTITTETYTAVSSIHPQTTSTFTSDTTTGSTSSIVTGITAVSATREEEAATSIQTSTEFPTSESESAEYVQKTTGSTGMTRFSTRAASDVSSTEVLHGFQGRRCHPQDPTAAADLVHGVIELLESTFHGSSVQPARPYEELRPRTERIIDTAEEIACHLAHAISDDPGFSSSLSYAVSVLRSLLEHESSYVDQRLQRTGTLMKSSIERLRSYHSVVTAFRAKLRLAVEVSIWENVMELLYAQPSNEMTEVLSWIDAFFGASDPMRSRVMFQDIMRDAAYDMEAFSQWIKGVVAFDVEAVMYHIVCSRLALYLNLTAPSSDSIDHCSHLDGVLLSVSKSFTLLQDRFPVHQLREDITGITALLKTYERVPHELKMFLEKKYFWLKWMVMISDSCSDRESRYVKFNLSQSLSGLRNGALLAEVSASSVFVAWKMDSSEAKPSGRSQSIALQRRQTSRDFPSADLALVARAQGTKSARDFLEYGLVPLLAAKRISWTTLVVVKEGCRPIVLPDVPAQRGAFFVSAVVGTPCRHLDLPFDCNSKLMERTVRVVVFPLT